MVRFSSLESRARAAFSLLSFRIYFTSRWPSADCFFLPRTRTPSSRYVSSAGVGALRNTWAPGNYSFGDAAAAAPGGADVVVTAHAEPSRLDALYVLGDALRDVLRGYATLTGAPFMPPIYALGLGDSDCYHNDRHGNSTRAAVAVARAYREQGFPAGWLLVNDGYGCGCARRREPLSLSLSRRV